MPLYSVRTCAKLILTLLQGLTLSTPSLVDHNYRPCEGGGAGALAGVAGHRGPGRERRRGEQQRAREVLPQTPPGR